MTNAEKAHEILKNSELVVEETIVIDNELYVICGKDKLKVSKENVEYFALVYDHKQINKTN